MNSEEECMRRIQNVVEDLKVTPGRASGYDVKGKLLLAGDATIGFKLSHFATTLFVELESLGGRSQLWLEEVARLADVPCGELQEMVGLPLTNPSGSLTDLEYGPWSARVAYDDGERIFELDFLIDSERCSLIETKHGALETFVDICSVGRESMRQRGIRLRQEKNYDGALEAFNEALRKRPNDIVTTFNRALLLEHNTRDLESAHHDYSFVIAHTTPNSELHLKCRKARAQILALVGDHSSALEDWTVYLSAYPDAFNARLDRGRSLTRLKRYEEALSDFDLALSIEGFVYDEVHELRAIALAEMGRHEQAEQAKALAEEERNRPNGLKEMFGDDLAKKMSKLFR
jgi:tetratricopeptide (TPR) repeat protein